MLLPLLGPPARACVMNHPTSRWHIQLAYCRTQGLGVAEVPHPVSLTSLHCSLASCASQVAADLCAVLRVWFERGAWHVIR